MKPGNWIALIGVSVAVGAGCAGAGRQFEARTPVLPALPPVTNLTSVERTNLIQSEWLQPSTNFFTLGPGDRVEIEVMGDPGTRASALVGPDGKLYYYLLPGVDVWGLRLEEAKGLLERELAAFMRNHPRVSISLQSAESKRVWLLGRLNSPGVYRLATPLTLLEALSLAGGPSVPPSFAALIGGKVTTLAGAGVGESADLQRSFVLRQGRLLSIDFNRLLREGDPRQNIYLQPDDFVYLPAAQSREVYVLGAVGQPQVLSYVGQISLVSAIARAGGAVTNAYPSHVAIVRGSLSEPRIAILNYQAIIKGHETDVLLEPHDIVYVPFSPFRVLTRYLDLILTTFVRTVGANEGARAASRGSGPIGVNVPIGF